MDNKRDNDQTTAPNRATIERTSDLEITVRRTVNALPRLVWEAWTQPELFRKWWVPRSFGLNLASCEMDVRAGGKYRLAFHHEGQTMEFFGTYMEVAPHARLVWTNEEGDHGTTVTQVTFEETAGQTLVAVTNHYPTKEALEADGSTEALPESLAQLDEFVAGLETSMDVR